MSRSTDNALCHAGRSNRADTPPLVPCDNGESTQARSAIHRPCSSVDKVVPPTDVIAGSDETASSPTSSGPGGDDQSSPPLHSRPAVSPLASNADVPCFCAVASAACDGSQVGGADQRVAAPPDRQTPHRAGELPVHRLEQLPDLLVGAVPFDGGPGVDDHLLRVGRNRMCDFEIHHRLGTRRAWLTPDQHRRESRQPRRVGEHVEVLLVVSAEFEEHDRRALAREAARRPADWRCTPPATPSGSVPGSARPAAGIPASPHDAGCNPGFGPAR